MYCHRYTFPYNEEMSSVDLTYFTCESEAASSYLSTWGAVEDYVSYSKTPQYVGMVGNQNFF